MQTKAFNLTATGQKQLIAGVSGQQIYVRSIFFTASLLTTAAFGDGSTKLSGDMVYAAGGGFLLPINNQDWFVTSAGNDLSVIFSGLTGGLNGVIWYDQV